MCDQVELDRPLTSLTLKVIENWSSIHARLIVVVFSTLKHLYLCWFLGV